jgi:hypothetical protein
VSLKLCWIMEGECSATAAAGNSVPIEKRVHEFLLAQNVKWIRVYWNDVSASFPVETGVAGQRPRLVEIAFFEKGCRTP